MVAVAVALAFSGCQWEVPDGPLGDDSSIDGSEVDASADGPVDAPADGTPMATLTVVRNGSATGTITSNAVGSAMIDCGTTCSAQFPPGSLVTLSETPNTGATFAGWAGVCNDTAPNCSFTLDSDTTLQATFNISRYRVTVTPGGNGSGNVTSNVGGIACPGTCEVMLDHGTPVTLTATPTSPSIFAGWNDAGCSGTGPCSFIVTRDEVIDAPFALNYTVTVSKNGNGRGTVTSSSPGINCGTDCDEVYSAGTPVTLTATANADTDFLGCGGACSGTGQCSFLVNAVVAVTANFALKRYPLTTARSGSGGGVVTSVPGGINCGLDCDELFDHDTPVTLTAVEDGTSSFVGWSEATCPGTGTCVVTMLGARGVSATFERDKTLSVAIGGNGDGAVSSSPGAIMTPSVTSDTYTHDTVVTLTASVNATTSLFGGWGGACSGAGTATTCDVRMDQARTVTATFTLRSYTLVLNKSGVGVGTVTSDVAGINCGTGCSTQTAPYNHGQTVVLSHLAGADSEFVAWGGSCTGATCSLSMTTDRTVSASFKRTDKLLTVSVTGNGTGTVASGDGGINAPSDPSQSYPHNTVVTLTASWNSTSTILSWSGACSGSAAMCVVTMDQARDVTATFTLRTYTLTVNKTGAGVGTVSSDVAGINCGTVCSTQMATYNHGQTVVLSHLAGADSEFVAWGGSCTGATCSPAMTADRTVSASFKRTDKLLTVTVSGTGTVASGDGGINAPSDPSQSYPHDTMVTLTASWNTTSHTFAWSGACSGSAAMCVVNMDQVRNVTATFTIRTWTLTVAKAGFGTGTVTSTSPAGVINCGVDCSEVVNHDTTVTLTAAPTGADIFFGWSGGGCSGTGACTTTVTAATTVTATFDNCVRSTQSCTSNNFMQCNASGDFVSHLVPNGGTNGTPITITYDGAYACPMGCHASQPRCNDISAVNGLNAALDAAATSATGYDLLLDDTSGDIIIDTSSYNAGTGTITIAEPGGQQHVVPATLIAQTAMAGFSAPNIMVLEVRTFTVGASARVKIRGSAAFGVASHFDIYIAGHLDLSGPSLGAGVSPNTSWCNGATANPVTGGGANQTAGGVASSGASGGQMLTNVSPNLQPLEGGCFGGAVNVNTLGGRGGGATQLVSRSKLAVAATGIVNVSGFRGAGAIDFFTSAVYAVGGGSGGGILLEAPAIAVNAGGRLAGRGGSGGAANRTTSTIANGNHGDWDLNAATVPGATCSGCGVGGNGGSETSVPGSGTGTTPAIGGGGGSAGRCHVRDRSGTYSPPAAAAKIHVISGTLGTR